MMRNIMMKTKVKNTPMKRKHCANMKMSVPMTSITTTVMGRTDVAAPFTLSIGLKI